MRGERRLAGRQDGRNDPLLRCVECADSLATMRMELYRVAAIDRPIPGGPGEPRRLEVMIP